MQLKLRSFGYDVSTTATNSDEAIEQVASYKPELVLMDINLGNGKDGIETAAILKERFQTPVVFVTSFSDKKTLERATHMMPLGYINKPLRDKDLKTTVALALEKLKTANESKSLETSPISDKSPNYDIEILCQSNGAIKDYNVGARHAMKSMGLSNPEELLPHNHRQVIEYALRIGNSYLVAGRLMDRIFSWEYIPNTSNHSATVVCEDLTDNRRISHSHSNEEAFKQALNYLSIGVLLVNNRLEPSFLNNAANLFIEQEDNIEIRDGVMTLATAELDTELIELVSSPKGGVLSIQERNQDSYTELLVSPIEINAQTQNSATPTAIIFVFHAHKDTERFEEILKALYHFSNAEARLASALVRDPRLEQAASSIGIKVNTARSHLKKIFQKTGTDRQSSLINHIVSGPAGLIIKTGEE